MSFLKNDKKEIILSTVLATVDVIHKPYNPEIIFDYVNLREMSLDRWKLHVSVIFCLTV